MKIKLIERIYSEVQVILYEHMSFHGEADIG